MTHGGKRKGAGRPPGRGPYGEATKPIRLPESLIKPVMRFVKNRGYQIPFYSSKVSAGLPFSVEDHVEAHIDLNDYLIKHPADTFLVRATGQSMIDVGIHENDMLVVDRKIHPEHGKIVIASLDGHLTVKRLFNKNNRLLLMPENKNFKPIEVKKENDISILGVVTNVIRDML